MPGSCSEHVVPLLRERQGLDSLAGAGPPAACSRQGGHVHYTRELGVALSNPGSLFVDYAHQPDLLYWLTGRAPRAVTTFGFQGGNLDLSSSPNVADIVCEYDDALLTTIHLNYVQMPHRHLYELVGDEGWASIDFETKQMTLGRRFIKSNCWMPWMDSAVTAFDQEPVPCDAD